MASGPRRCRGSAGMTNRKGGFWLSPLRGSAGMTQRKRPYQLIVITTAAKATSRTAIAATSTVTPVASALISPSRRAPNAARCGGTLGIAGRESIMPSSTRGRGDAASARAPTPRLRP